MSPLTKILIVLLTISSIFLCGIVVTYVANADNWKQKYEGQIDELNRTKASAENDRALLKEKSEEYARLEDKLRSEIASLTTRLGEVEGNLRDVERQKAMLEQEVNSWVAVTANFSETTDKQRQLFENTFAELNRVKTERIKDHKELDQLTTSLEEKMAIIAMLDEKTKSLLEEKVELQDRLDKLYQPFGKEAAAPTPVIPKKAIARPAPPTRDIELKGLIKVVDLKNSIAGISIGKAAGVKVGMKFHVTRGDEFICDILIIDVDAEEAVGVLELIKQQPKAGDNISTNL
ncbi:hypothetical protein ES703_27941 [subsurface metagenome]